MLMSKSDKQAYVCSVGCVLRMTRILKKGMSNF